MRLHAACCGASTPLPRNSAKTDTATRARRRNCGEMSYRIFAANEWESMEKARFPTKLIGGESRCGTGIASKYLVRTRSGFC